MLLRLRAFVAPFACAAALAQTAAGPPPPPTAAAKAPASVVAGIPVNYEEAKTGQYTLPDPLKLANGKPVRDRQTWEKQRRPEIVKLFEEDQYGRAPGKPAELTFDVFDMGTPAFDGLALRKQVTVYFSADRQGPHMDLVVYTPAAATKPVPLVLTINFSPNAAIFADDGIRLGTMWNREKKQVPAERGRGLGRMDVKPVLAAGFGVAGVYYGDIEPDFAGGAPLGVRQLYLKNGSEPASDEWGAISTWAWGLSRALDYLEADRSVDAKKVALFGVSRLGKTVMWAGAHDQRFAAVIASCSGEGGAALSRRNYGETIAHLMAPTRYPYQFAANWAKFAADPGSSPIDANLLVALMAPRPVLLQTGDTDFWSDPKGEFLAAVAAEPVYKLYGKDGLGTTEMPAAGQPILHTISYYEHVGGHGSLPTDWPVFIKFLQTYLAP